MPVAAPRFVDLHASSRQPTGLALNVVLTLQRCHDVHHPLPPPPPRCAVVVAAGFYTTLPYFLAKLVCDLVPLRVFPPALFGLIVYHMLGLTDEPSRYWYFVMTVVVINVTATMVCYTVSTFTTSVPQSNVFATLIFVFNILFGGLLLTARTPTITFIMNFAIFAWGWQVCIALFSCAHARLLGAFTLSRAPFSVVFTCNCDACRCVVHVFTCNFDACRGVVHAFTCNCDACRCVVHVFTCNCDACRCVVHVFTCNCDACRCVVHVFTCNCNACRCVVHAGPYG
jgi:hypothetical protein